MNTPMNTSWKEMSVHRSEGPSRLLQGPPVGFQDFKKILQEQVLSGGVGFVLISSSGLVECDVGTTVWSRLKRGLASVPVQNRNHPYNQEVSHGRSALGSFPFPGSRGEHHTDHGEQDQRALGIWVSLARFPHFPFVLSFFFRVTGSPSGPKREGLL